MRKALSVADDETLAAWCVTPEWDERTLAEFVADNGRPIGPPNRDERGRRVGTDSTGAR